MVSSINISQIPRFIKNDESSFFDFLLPTIKTDNPARKQKVGAQKCVINLVKNMGKVECVGSEGLNKKEEELKKSLTWSSAIITITKPFKRSIDSILFLVSNVII
jgi:hypothetical protein